MSDKLAKGAHVATIISAVIGIPGVLILCANYLEDHEELPFPLSPLSEAILRWPLPIAFGLVIVVLFAVPWSRRFIIRWIKCIYLWVLWHLVIRPAKDYLMTGAELLICSATYGYQDRVKDVTQIVLSNVKDGKLELDVLNENLGGDPAPHKRKKLQVVYIQLHAKTVLERDTLSLP